MLDLGFGFVEVGTVTPLPQAGNPKPRVFRLPKDGAVINRLGFNNAGAERMAVRLARGGARPPLVLKLDPDMAVEDATLAAARAADEGFDGLAVSNTTVARPGTLIDAARRETGGLSGRPLFRRSTELLRAVFRAQGHRLPVIGVGGVDSAETAYEKITAGASLVQLYTALIYEGPLLVTAILDGLERRLAADSFESVTQAIGVEA